LCTLDRCSDWHSTLHRWGSNPHRSTLMVKPFYLCTYAH